MSKTVQNQNWGFRDMQILARALELENTELRREFDIVRTKLGIERTYQEQLKQQLTTLLSVAEKINSALEGMSEMCGNYFDESGLVCSRDKEIWAKHVIALSTFAEFKKEQGL